MSTELQHLADILAHRLGRSLVVEDRHQRLLVYTEHSEPLDDVRRESILSRQAAPAVVAFLARFGLDRLRAPARIPGCDRLGMLPRVCVPIRHQDVLLCFLWFVDADAPMSDEEIEAARVDGAELGHVLHRQRLGVEFALQHEEDAMRQLLGPDRTTRSEAAARLSAAGQVTDGASVVALVCAPALTRARGTDQEIRLALEQALVTARRRIGPRRSLHLLRADHGVLVVEDPHGSPAAAQRRGHELHQLLRTETRDLDDVTDALIGIGDHCERLEDVRGSYERAHEALEVIRQLRSVGPVARWDHLGIYRALIRLDDTDVGDGTMHPGLARLLGCPEHGELITTLEAYLDLAGSAQQTAARLNIHRGTLYHRLHRIERLAGTCMRDGRERLALHLGLKLARLHGQLDAAEP